MKRVITLTSIYLFIMILFPFPSLAQKANELMVIHSSEHRSLSTLDTSREYLRHVEISISQKSLQDELEISNEFRTLSTTTLRQNQNWFMDSLSIPVSWSYPALRPVTIAVIDSGISDTFINDKGIQRGINFINPELPPIDDNGHGTMITSVIKTTIGNLPIEIIPLKVADSKGGLYVSDIVRAIDYAIEQQVDVINLSFAGRTPNTAENHAIQMAVKKGVLVVAAAGNTGTSAYYYPASYDHVQSIGSIGKTYVRSPFSNYNDTVDFVAPGEQIAVIDHFNFLRLENGTSFAAAYASAIFAMGKSQQPFVNKPIEHDIIKAITDLGPVGKDEEYGYGLLNTDQWLVKLRGVELSQEAAQVGEYKTWTVHFNQPLHPSAEEVTDGIQVLDQFGETHPIELLISSDRLSVQVIPSVPFKKETMYWLFVNPVWKNTDGNVLKAKYSKRFVIPY